jgi:membrane protein DedA with SNARE-associated domain
VESFLETVSQLPPLLVYALIGIGAALENLIPPIPADTFVLFGGFIAGQETVNAWVVWLVTWAFNVSGALVVYGLGHRHGKRFFQHGLGKHMLNEHQLERMQGFYKKYGPVAMFCARFLPGLRAVVPAFAGVSHQPFLPAAIPLVAASAIWYGALVWVGATAGRNLDALMAVLDKVNYALLGVAVLIFGGIFVWWWRTRHGKGGKGESGHSQSPQSMKK